jgi:hypothetical protein
MFSYSDPHYRHPTQRERRAGVWECPTCECVNDPNTPNCWNCEQGREQDENL